jgi:exosortase
VSTPVNGATPSRNRRKKPERQKSASSIPSVESSAANVSLSNFDRTTRIWLVAAIVVAGIWSYWPTLVDLVGTWNREPDYSHGFLVLPVSLYFLWIRRSTCPALTATSPVLALGFTFVAVAMRYVGARYFYGFLDGWSILPWVAAIAAATGGWRLLVWSLPSICFLFFMIPLPFSLEGQLSQPLQKIATKISCATLQTCGFPAFAEGNVILLNKERFEVAQACSGLRLFISILALTYAYIVIIQRPWWEKLGLAIVAIPVAIIANSGRIVATAVLYQFTESESLRQFAHDSAGWATILFAGAILWAFLLYFRWVIREEEIMDVGALIRESAIARQTPATGSSS